MRFVARLAPSALDSKPAIVLDYSAAGELVWGRIARMRDELRELPTGEGEPRVLLGIGSMGAFGGMRNGAPFVLVEGGPA